MYKKVSNLIIQNKNSIKYGLITNTVIGILLRGVGDSIQQTIEVNNSRKKDTNRKESLVSEINTSNEKSKEKNGAGNDVKQVFDWTRTSILKIDYFFFKIQSIIIQVYL